MYAILISAAWSVLTWLVRTVILKFVLYAVIYLIITDFLPALISKFVPDVSTMLTNALTALPAGVWWFMDLFQATAGIPLVLSAVAVRFIIRRLPLVG